VGGRRTLNGPLDAVTFLTRIPLRAKRRADTDTGNAVPWFPVVGAAIGLLIGAVYAGCAVALPHLLAATIALAVGLLVTGALHEDGLGDVADAFGGGRDQDDALRIMKDPRLGTFGVLAIVMSVLVRIVGIASLGGPVALVVLPAVHSLSRSAAVGAMTIFEPVHGGLGSVYSRSLVRRRVILGIAGGTLIAAVLVRVWVLPAVAIGAVVAGVMGALARRKIGGINGDVLGAIEQLTEMALLVGAVALVHAHLAVGW